MLISGTGYCIFYVSNIALFGTNVISPKAPTPTPLLKKKQQKNKKKTVYFRLFENSRIKPSSLRVFVFLRNCFVFAKRRP